MGKITTYLAIMTGVSLLMYFGNVIPANPLISLLINITTIQNSSFYLKMLAGITTFVTLGGLSLGIYNAKDLETIAMWSVAVLLLNLGFDFLNIFLAITALNTGYTVIGLLLFSPLMFIWIFSIIEWWRGITT